MLRTGLLLLVALSLAAEPRATQSDYPAHVTLDRASIGAEYRVHSFFGRNQTFVCPDYLVVEIGFYPASADGVTLANTHFTLRLNGKKQVLFAQPAAFVANSLKYPDWEVHPTLVAGAGVGDVNVTVGRPRTVERFPGDRRPSQTRLPTPPRSPEAEDRSEKPQSARPEEVVMETALPDGTTRTAVGGQLYFAYKGKVKSIRSVELIYNGPAGTVTLRLL